MSFSFYLGIDRHPALAAFRSDVGRRDAPRGSSAPIELAPVLDRAAEWLPPYFAELLARATGVYVQPIVSTVVRRYAASRTCLVGDAGSVFPPWSNGGVASALGNASSLAIALSTTLDVANALRRWSDDQVAADRAVSFVADRLRHLLIRNVPDVADLTTEGIAQYLEAIHPGMPLSIPKTAKTITGA